MRTVVPRALAWLSLAGLVVCGTLHAQAPDEAPSVAVAAPRPHVARHAPASRFEQRMAMLTAALELDAQQQVQVRKVLEDQREAVMKVAGDGAVPADRRVMEMKAIGDRTAERIRALLSDEQKQKYKPPPLAHDALGERTGPSVEEWMDATRPK